MQTPDYAQLLEHKPVWQLQVKTHEIVCVLHK